MTDPITTRARLLDELAAAQPGEVLDEIYCWLYAARWPQDSPVMSVNEAKSLLLAALYEAQEPHPNWQAWLDQAQRYGLAPRDAIRLAFRADAISRMIYPASVQEE